MPSGGHFVGELNADFKQHGEGAEYHADGSEVASGQWREGKQHGRGKQTFLDCSCYVGQFVAGRQSGLGQFTWSDGSVYMGEFRDDHMNGLGMRWDARGRLTQCGLWKDCELVESRPVPRSVITDDSLLTAKGERSCRNASTRRVCAAVVYCASMSARPLITVFVSFSSLSV